VTRELTVWLSRLRRDGIAQPRLRVVWSALPRLRGPSTRPGTLLLKQLAAAALCVGLAAPALAQEKALGERCRDGVAAGDFRTCAAAVEASPADPQLRRLYAQSLAKAADYDGSIGQYREITRLTPADGRAHYEYAWMLAFVRRYSDAVDPIEQSMRLQPTHVESFRAAAIIYQLIKRPADVFRVSLAGARLGDSVAMFDTYDCYEKGIGTPTDPAQAYAWLVKAAEAGHVTAMDRLAELYLNGGLGRAPDEKMAEEWATKARRARGRKL
jgi:TPR repeat protein